MDILLECMSANHLYAYIAHGGRRRTLDTLELKLDGYEPPCRCRELNPVLGKSSQCSQLLCHLSSPKFIFFLNKCFQKAMIKIVSGVWNSD